MFCDVFDALLDQLQGSRMFKIKLFVLCVCALYKSQFLQKIFFSNCKQSCEGNLKKGNFKQDQWWSKHLSKLLVQHKGLVLFYGDPLLHFCIVRVAIRHNKYILHLPKGLFKRDVFQAAAFPLPYKCPCPELDLNLGPLVATIS